MHNEHESNGRRVGEDKSTSARSFRLGIPQILFSMKFAIWIAVILAAASIAGILVQEFYPVRNDHQAHTLSQILPAPLYALFMTLELYDPFRALWFRVLLGLLSLSLLLCSLRNFRPNFTQAFRVRPLRDPRTLTRFPDSYRFNRVSPALFDSVVQTLRRRWFVGTVERLETQYAAAFHRGGIARTGPVLLHVGILVLVVGGLLSSLVGQRTVLMGAPGDFLALGDGTVQLRVERFDIDTNERGQVKQYRSHVTVIENGSEVLEREIEVNKPLRYAGFNVYQSTYQVDPSRASNLGIRVLPRLEQDEAHEAAQGHGMAARGPETAHLEVDMNGPHEVEGHPGYTFRVRRFFAHLKITPDGPVNASRDMVNPAAELEVFHEGAPVAVQWAFARFPAHARDELPFVLELAHAEPLMATGLEVNTNPGAPLIWLGLVVSTIALVFCFLIQHHTIYVVARPDESGWTLWLAGRSSRERIAFSNAFERFARDVHRQAKKLKAIEREAVETAAPAATPEAVADAEVAHR